MNDVKRTGAAMVMAGLLFGLPQAWIDGAGAKAADDAPGKAAAVDIGQRRELFVDNFLIERMDGCSFRLQHPVPREVAAVHDKPWEGNACWAHTVFQDEKVYRMYYLARHFDVHEYTNTLAHPVFTAYMESKDGVTWERPELGIVEFNGDKKNNIVYPTADSAFPEARLLVPFKDENPECAADARYKALAGRAKVDGKWSLLALKSADAIHWTLMSDKPVISEGVLDSQNVAFWDAGRKEYRVYFRDYRPLGDTEIRDVRTATSKDFVNWSKSEFLQYPGAPDEQIYASQVKPYHRAPQILVGLPLRYTDRMPAPNNITFRQYAMKDSILHMPNWNTRTYRGSNRRYATAFTDTLLMTSRDGRSFHRWPDAFLRPGPGNWTYGDNLVAWQIVETPSGGPDAPPELSFYAVENYWSKDRRSDQLRRYTLRLDGFAALGAPAAGGKALTKPLVFSGKALEINYATSAAGSMTIEIQDQDGGMIPGYANEDCHELFGDDTARIVAWNGGRDVGKLAGRPVRLLLTMREADLYSLRFVPEVPQVKKFAHLAGYEKEGVTFAKTANRLVVDTLAQMKSPATSAKAVSEAVQHRLDALPDVIAKEDYKKGFYGTVTSIAKSAAAIPKAEKAPDIDGKTVPGEWEKAVRLEGFKLAGTGAAPRFDTQAMMCRDDQKLYIAFTCKEQDAGALIVNEKSRDGQVWRGDCVQLFFQGADGKVRQVVVDSAGTIWDGLAGDESWNGKAVAATSIDKSKNEWTVELAVPFTDLGIEPKTGTVMRGNLCRSDIAHQGQFWFKDAEHSSWCPALTSFGDSNTFGIFIFE